MMLGEASQLECRADGFYPPPVTLAWTRDGQVIQPAARLDGERTADGFYRAAANLTYYPSRWDQNATFGCQVSHSGVDQELKFQLNITCECPPFFFDSGRGGSKTTSSAVLRAGCFRAPRRRRRAEEKPRWLEAAVFEYGARERCSTKSHRFFQVVA